MNNHFNTLLPFPQKLESRESCFRLTNDTKLLVDENISDQFAANEVIQFLQARFGLNLEKSKAGSGSGSGPKIILGKPGSNQFITELCESHGLSFAEKMAREGYFLDANEERVIIAAESDAGLFYGCMTLTQLFEKQNDEIFVPGVSIADWPEIEFRGVTDDMSRGQVSTLDNFKKIIRFMATFKMNCYMPYIEDIFKFEKHPEIGKNRGALTKEEMIELQDYAEQYHVQIIPIFQTLGHYEIILSLPKYRHLAEYPGAASLNTADERVYPFLESLLDEIIPVFRSPYFHIGADESWDVGRGANKQRAEQIGLAKIHTEHYKRVFEMVRKHGKTILMYGDIILRHPEALEDIPDDIIMFDWHYNRAEHYPSVDVFKKSGKEFMVSPGVSNWDRIFPDHTEALGNIRNLALEGYQNGARGVVTSNWGDRGSMNFRELTYFGYAFTGNCAWNPTAAEIDRFENVFFPRFYGTDSAELKLAYKKLDDLSRIVQIFEIWQHPFLAMDKTPENESQKAQFLLNEMATVLDLLNKAEKNCVINRDHIDYLRNCAKWGLWLGQKIELAQWFHSLHKDFDEAPEKARASLCQQGITSCQEIIKELRLLSAEYQQLWLRHNRAENLHFIVTMLDRQLHYWEQKIQQLEAGIFRHNPSLRSKWITLSEAADLDEEQPRMFLRKAISLTQKPVKAMLQLTAHTYAKPFVNGKQVGIVCARGTNSMTTEMQRTLAWDITEKLFKGKNVIAIEATRYDDRPEFNMPQVNCYVWLKMADGSVETILSNDDWLACPAQESHWTDIDFDAAHWQRTKIVSEQWYAAEPDFENDWPSWIE